jgi:hypothetical protein
MLSTEERGEIERELDRYPDRRALSIEALKVVQRHRGWVSDDGLRDVADFLGLSPAGPRTSRASRRSTTSSSGGRSAATSSSSATA